MVIACVWVGGEVNDLVNTTCRLDKLRKPAGSSVYKKRDTGTCSLGNTLHEVQKTDMFWTYDVSFRLLVAKLRANCS